MLLPVHVALLELKRFLVNRGELAFSIALPIVLFALMQGIGSGQTFNGTAHVVNLDRGELGELLLDTVDAIDGVEVKHYSAEDLDAAIDRSAVLSGVVIPAEFTSSLKAGEPVAISFKRRGSGGDEGQIVSRIITGVARGLFLEYEARALAGILLSDTSSDVIATAVAGAFASADVDSVRITGEARQEEDNRFADRVMPGILVMFLMFAVTLSAQTIVEERSNGTLERLMTTRLGAGRLFWGKFLAGIARAMFQAIVLLGLAFVVLRPAGPSAFAQALVFVAFVAAAVSAIGLVIASVARTRDQANWAAVFVTMFMVIFGGTFFPIAESGFLAVLAQLTVNHHAIGALESILSDGGSLGGELAAMGVMVGTAVAGLLVARFTFRVTENG